MRTTVARHGSAPILVALVVVLALAGCELVMDGCLVRGCGDSG